MARPIKQPLVKLLGRMAAKGGLTRIEIGDDVRKALSAIVKRPRHGDVERVADHVNRANRDLVRKQGFA